MAKMERERTVKERRARKQEKKQAAAADAAQRSVDGTPAADAAEESSE